MQHLKGFGVVIARCIREPHEFELCRYSDHSLAINKNGCFFGLWEPHVQEQAIHAFMLMTLSKKTIGLLMVRMCESTAALFDRDWASTN